MTTCINYIYVISYYTNNGNIKELNVIADDSHEAIAFVRTKCEDFKEMIVCQRIKD